MLTTRARTNCPARSAICWSRRTTCSSKPLQSSQRSQRKVRKIGLFCVFAAARAASKSACQPSADADPASSETANSAANVRVMRRLRGLVRLSILRTWTGGPADAGADMWDVVVVGAGAAGLMAAIRAAERGRRTLLLEKNRKAGVKILMSGGTRCNITHATDDRGI